MRNWMTIVNEALSEDLTFKSIEDGEIVLGDPENDEVEHLEDASEEEKEDMLRALERDLHGSTDGE